MRSVVSSNSEMATPANPKTSKTRAKLLLVAQLRGLPHVLGYTPILAVVPPTVTLLHLGAVSWRLPPAGAVSGWTEQSLWKRQEVFHTTPKGADPAGSGFPGPDPQVPPNPAPS